MPHIINLGSRYLSNLSFKQTILDLNQNHSNQPMKRPFGGGHGRAFSSQWYTAFSKVWGRRFMLTNQHHFSANNDLIPKVPIIMLHNSKTSHPIFSGSMTPTAIFEVNRLFKMVLLLVHLCHFPLKQPLGGMLARINSCFVWLVCAYSPITYIVLLSKLFIDISKGCS